ncbi:dienelactone hydrolase family protein [Parasphingorhabdus sp.]|uniref:dienelactone hydrolase family protein n=1 Tax=Parasphingorhabdus sp. TaxID=2709688 RepID=UPI002F952237
MTYDISEGVQAREVEIQLIGLKAILTVPKNATAMIIFAHGSGSGRLSPRNNHVAAALREDGFATLLLDLLTPEEEQDRANVFNIELLAKRLSMAASWVREQPAFSEIPIGYFGASTGAGAALVAAARDEPQVAAVVSRGGRPDMAGTWLDKVHAPTLLIVGSLDGPVIDLNKEAYDMLQCPKRLTIINGARHLFEEPGTLEEVIVHASAWFSAHCD